MTTTPNITHAAWTAGSDIKVNDVLHFGVGILATDKIIALTGLMGADNEDESIANSFLISAAPDLLASLITLAGHVAHYAAMPHAHPDAHRDVANAYAAINKATGA
jgi:hypothetical protein